MSKIALRRIAFILMIALGAIGFVATVWLDAEMSDSMDQLTLATLIGAEAVSDDSLLTPGLARQVLSAINQLPDILHLNWEVRPAFRVYAYSDIIMWVSIAVSIVGVVLLLGTTSQPNKKRFDTKRVALCGLLLAMMLVLGWVEHLIPLNAGIPGIKLGLSNGVLIFAVYMLDAPTSFVLMALKVLLSCAFLGTPASMMIYGFAGGLLSLTGMLLLSKVKGLHPVTVSMVGGALHNVGQVGVAMLILNTPNLLYYMAGLMVVGLLCGLLTGVCADRVMKYMKHVKL